MNENEWRGFQRGYEEARQHFSALIHQARKQYDEPFVRGLACAAVLVREHRCKPDPKTCEEQALMETSPTMPSLPATAEKGSSDAT